MFLYTFIFIDDSQNKKCHSAVFICLIHIHISYKTRLLCRRITQEISTAKRCFSSGKRHHRWSHCLLQAARTPQNCSFSSLTHFTDTHLASVRTSAAYLIHIISSRLVRNPELKKHAYFLSYTLQWILNHLPMLWVFSTMCITGA
jgi:hypothetical protein